jgi:uncharacterized FlgJ-related protein
MKNLISLTTPKIPTKRNWNPFINLSLLLTFLLFSSVDHSNDVGDTQNDIVYESVLEYVNGTEEAYIACTDSLVIAEAETKEQAFLKLKHTVTSDYLINYNANRLESLSDSILKKLNKEIAISFIEIVLKHKAIDARALNYFTNNTDLNKIETALMEQVKYNVPASIKLAQSALETGYGTKVVANNYFGIKSKKGKLKAVTTTEYYTLAEYKTNKSIIVRAKQIQKDGKTLYKCTVKDYFAGYNSAWESFREHSIFLSTNKRYAPLFTNGKNYEDWANEIGSTKYGGVGYATAPNYGQVLKKIIINYSLDLLDY